MSDSTSTRSTIDYSSLGFVDAPFVLPAEGATESDWVRLVANAAANRLLSACVRARARACPVLVTTDEEIPEYYYRLAQNDLLGRAATEPRLGIMALNIPLEMMRLGRIRGTIAELAELVVAVNMPATIASWYLTALDAPDETLPESGLVTAAEISEARDLFADSPRGAVKRYLSFDAKPLAESEMDVVVHEAYLRQLGQPIDVDKNDEGPEVVPFDPMGNGEVVSAVPEVEDSEPVPTSDEHMREYLLALARTRLSPVIARALAAYGQYGEALAAQELKITKAPRKTLAALMRFMGSRWGNLIVIYDNFESWPMLDQQAKIDVLTSLTELRHLIAETGVMVVGVVKGMAPEIEELFAAGEHVDWALPEVHALSRGERGFNAEWVQSWLDAASVTGASALKADGSELAPLVEACGGDLVTFARMAQAALRDAAERGTSEVDAAAVAAGIESGKVEAGS